MILARAKGGSILFDEIGDFDDDAQGRIVRMLDQLGEASPRIMASSQRDLMGKMEGGGFRQDLFLPPWRRGHRGPVPARTCR